MKADEWSEHRWQALSSASLVEDDGLFARDPLSILVMGRVAKEGHEKTSQSVQLSLHKLYII